MTAMETSAPVLSAKLHRMFTMLDADGDGLMSEEDLPRLADRLREGFGRAGETVRTDRLRALLAAIWDHHLARADEDGDGRIDAATYDRAVRHAVATRRSELLADFSAMVTAWLDLCDLDGNGLIDRDEYRLMLRVAFDAPHEASDAAFDRLDADGNGTLEPEEVQAAVEDYFTSNDGDAPGNWLFGPL
ncbi:EF-hand domain-containing protein [Streptomyces sp. N35]|uniref:EF-hand domain-containing protein n=1 Tax=Streptomyces sp. N35 TaxID=2795730 RepID=UPI0018F7CA9B|nr:EF-hand domain-containing protein [Streptomyces sp. N35]